MAFLGILMHLLKTNVSQICQECCPWCMCKVCSSLGQKWGNERAITGSKIILTSPFRMGSEFLAREDLENMMTLVLSGFSVILHLAHHFASFRRSLCKSFAANCTFYLAVHRAVSSANWDFEFCLWWGFGKSLTYIRKSNLLRTERVIPLQQGWFCQKGNHSHWLG